MVALLRRIYTSVIPLLSILLVGAYLRLYRIGDYLTFLGDEGRDVLVVKRMIVDGKFTLLGPTASVGGFYMGPIYYYFMLPFLWVAKLDPIGPAIMVALVGVATIYLLYKMGLDFFGRFVAITAAAIYALSPLVIAYSRSSWNPNLVPFFSTLLIYLCFKFTEHKKVSLAFWMGVIMGIGIQLHYTFLFLFPVVYIWMVLRLRMEVIKGVGYSILGFLVGFSPFLAFEFRHEFTNTKGIIAFVLAGRDTGFSSSHFMWNIRDIFFRLFGRLILRIPDGGMFDMLTDYQKQMWTIGTWATASIATFVPIISWYKGQYTKRQWDMIVLLYLWVAFGLCLFGIYKKSIYDYYFGIFFVVPFILTALLFSSLWVRGNIGKFISTSILAILLLFNWQGRPFLHEPNRQLHQAKTIARVVLDKTDGKPFNFALVTGGNSDHAYRYFFEIWGHPPVIIENAANDPDRKTVMDQLLIVCEDTNCEPLGHSLWEISGFGRAKIAGKWDVSVVKIYKLVKYREEN